MTTAYEKPEEAVSHNSPESSKEKVALEDENIVHDPRDMNLSLRSIVVGSFLGCVIAASNIYLGLKAGWTFGAGLFGSIFGFALLKSWSKVSGKYFGMKENCALQTAATAAGGLSAGFVSAIPVLYRKKLFGTTPMNDLTSLMLWTFCASYYGLFFAIPLRKYYILKQKLVFPSPTAAAEAIRSLHNGAGGAAEGMKQAKLMFFVMLGSIVFLFMAHLIPVLKTWHIFYWVGLPSVDAWFWVLEATPAFTGAGMMTGTNTNLSFLLGTVLAWGVVGPLLLKYGIVVDIASFNKNSPARPSARYWLLWPGVTLMLVSSFTELFCQWPTLWRGIKNGIAQLTGGSESDEAIEDPAPDDEQVPTMWWMVGLVVSVTMTVFTLWYYFDLNPGLSLLAIFLSFMFSFIALQASGETDMNPTGTIAKTSQMVFAAFRNGTQEHRMKVNLMAGNVAAAAAGQTSDMVGDLKTGHLLRASPRAQFLAQAAGTFPAVFIGPIVFALFCQAFPCIVDETVDCKGQFALVAVTAWEGVATALTSDSNPLPVSSIWACVVCAVLGVALTIARCKAPPAYKEWIPGMNSVGIGLISMQTQYPIAMCVGGLIQHLWSKHNPSSAEANLPAVASGMIAGEGLWGIIGALLIILKLPEGYISVFGMPGDE
jgi:OPT family oligopeptide transporter